MEKIQKNIQKSKVDLEALKKDIILELSALDSDMSTLHKQIIALGIHHPNLQELIEFIVYINDRLDTKGSQAEDIVVTSFTNLININNDLVITAELLFEKINVMQSKKSTMDKLLSKITSINDVKTLFGIGVVVALIVAKVFFPESSSELYESLITILLPQK